MTETEVHGEAETATAEAETVAETAGRGHRGETRPDWMGASQLSVPITLGPRGTCPSYASQGAAGADLAASVEAPLEILPGERAAVPTGIRMEVPAGYEAQVRPRSGLALSSGVTVLNSPGTIDSDYRGEVKVIIANHGRESFTIQPGDRIAQLVLTPVIRARFFVRESLENTERGEGGFGSTGV